MNQDFNVPVLLAEMESLDRGKKLARLIRDPEWAAVPEMLEAYRDGAGNALRALPPGDPSVVTAHAAWSALADLCLKFNEDINRFIRQEPSDELKAYLLRAREHLDPMVTMERA